MLESLSKIKSEKNFQQKSHGVSEVQNSLIKRLREFKRDEKQSSHHLPPKPSMKWSKPPMSTIKINYDAAVSPHKVALAIVARDHNGDLVWVETNIIPGCYSLVAEAQL